jgi:hypothetical protein
VSARSYGLAWWAQNEYVKDQKSSLWDPWFLELCPAYTSTKSLLVLLTTYADARRGQRRYTGARVSVAVFNERCNIINSLQIRPSYMETTRLEAKSHHVALPTGQNPYCVLKGQITD